MLSKPALRALKNRHSGARMVFLGVARTATLVQGFGLFDEVVSLAAYDERKRVFRMTRLKEIVGVLGGLRREQFDCVINMRSIISWPSALKMALLFCIIGAKQRLGRDTAGRGFFLNTKVEETHFGDKHEMDYDLDTVALLGADGADCRINLQVGPQDAAAVDHRLEERGVKREEPVIGIHAGGVPSHRWPLPCFAQTVTMIAEKTGARFVITGGPSEEGLFDRLQAMTQVRLVNMVQRTSFGQLVALIDRCRLFISTDTGPMHLAAALGKPLVAIMGGGPFKRYDPRRISDKVIVLHKEVPCGPCTKKRCSDLKCLKAITPPEVAEAALKLWQG